MFARKRIRAPIAKLATRERSDCPEASNELASIRRDTYRDVEATRLLLLELGQRHGPTD